MPIIWSEYQNQASRFSRNRLNLDSVLEEEDDIAQITSVSDNVDTEDSRRRNDASRTGRSFFTTGFVVVVVDGGRGRGESCVRTVDDDDDDDNGCFIGNG